MAGTSLALGFAELAVAAIILDRGARSFTGAFTGSDSTPTSPVDSAGNVTFDSPPETGPAAAERMLTFASSHLGLPYVWGGGHGSIGDPTDGGFDCSGFVAAILHAGGFLTSTPDTVTFPDQAGIDPGQGQYVTIWNRPLPGDQGHVIINVLGEWFESGGRLGGGTVQMTAAQAKEELDGGGFDPLHPTGL